MADPLAFGFMPMNQALAMNQGFSGASPSSADVLMSLLEASRAQSQRQFANSPFGDSFNRRFGDMAGMMLPGEEAVPPSVGPSPEDVARLQAALMQAGDGSLENQVTRQGTSGTYAGPVLNATGPLQAQPWYDEYLAAAKGGADLPMVRGNGGTPVDQDKQAAYRKQRQETMAGRQANVQSNALMDSAARRQRMTGMADPRYVAEMLGRIGASGGGMASDAFLYGPEAAVNLQDIAMRGNAVNSQAQMAADARAQEAQQFAQEMGLNERKLLADIENAKATRALQERVLDLKSPQSPGGFPTTPAPPALRATPTATIQNPVADQGLQQLWTLRPNGWANGEEFITAARARGYYPADAIQFLLAMGQPNPRASTFMDRHPQLTGWGATVGTMGIAPPPDILAQLISDLGFDGNPEPAGLPARFKNQLPQR